MFLRLITLLVTALSLGPSFAHVLEAPPRLTKWSPELWRETTVFNGQYLMFGMIGGALDAAAVIASAILAFMLRGNRPAFRFALAGAILFALSLIAWVSLVSPANSVLATWVPGPLPADFRSIQHRWEFGHMVVAGLKVLGFIAVSMAVLRASDRLDHRL